MTNGLVLRLYIPGYNILNARFLEYKKIYKLENEHFLGQYSIYWHKAVAREKYLGGGLIQFSRGQI